MRNTADEAPNTKSSPIKLTKWHVYVLYVEWNLVSGWAFELASMSERSCQEVLISSREALPIFLHAWAPHTQHFDDDFSPVFQKTDYILCCAFKLKTRGKTTVLTTCYCADPEVLDIEISDSTWVHHYTFNRHVLAFGSEKHYFGCQELTGNKTEKFPLFVWWCPKWGARCSRICCLLSM